CARSPPKYSSFGWSGLDSW
nr:immunoglobulin heavy chain junction region [Macaca mulatta]